MLGLSRPQVLSVPCSDFRCELQWGCWCPSLRSRGCPKIAAAACCMQYKSLSSPASHCILRLWTWKCRSSYLPGRILRFERRPQFEYRSRRGLALPASSTRWKYNTWHRPLHHTKSVVYSRNNMRRHRKPAKQIKHKHIIRKKIVQLLRNVRTPSAWLCMMLLIPIILLLKTTWWWCMHVISILTKWNFDSNIAHNNSELWQISWPTDKSQMMNKQVNRENFCIRVVRENGFMRPCRCVSRGY